MWPARLSAGVIPASTRWTPTRPACLKWLAMTIHCVEPRSRRRESQLPFPGIRRLRHRNTVRKSRVVTHAVPIACVLLALGPTSCRLATLQRPPGLQKETLRERAYPSVSVWIGADQETGTRYHLYADSTLPDAQAGPCTRASRAGPLRVIGALQTEDAGEDDNRARRLVMKGADLLLDYCADELGHY